MYFSWEILDELGSLKVTSKSLKLPQQQGWAKFRLKISDPSKKLFFISFSCAANR